MIWIHEHIQSTNYYGSSMDGVGLWYICMIFMDHGWSFLIRWGNTKQCTTTRHKINKNYPSFIRDDDCVSCSDMRSGCSTSSICVSTCCCPLRRIAKLRRPCSTFMSVDIPYVSSLVSNSKTFFHRPRLVINSFACVVPG
jgi:hypothetical protein